MISNPILHDIIKSELTHNAKTVFEICKSIDPIKTSNLFKKDYWSFKEARQEQLNRRYYQADCVWYFEGKEHDNYFIVHEVKTGNYSVIDIYNKYKTGMSGQIWVWGWKQVNDTKTLGETYKRKVKLVDIEHLNQILLGDLYTLYSGLLG